MFSLLQDCPAPRTPAIFKINLACKKNCRILVRQPLQLFIFLLMYSGNTGTHQTFIPLFRTNYPTPENNKSKGREYQRCNKCKPYTNNSNYFRAGRTDPAVSSSIAVAIWPFTMTVMKSITIKSFF